MSPATGGHFIFVRSQQLRTLGYILVLGGINLRQMATPLAPPFDGNLSAQLGRAGCSLKLPTAYN
ncbi:prostaglandin reductase 1 [Anopheles sinensis]|uniref:Prostaglandin reductase 1 n=1 Tax=Anopheles sinensis TaxID=74873 RepID=A0A084W3S4_ANOSI|nr:prostaglandin reductase 1 [Anopheles sinensis]